MPSGFRTLKVYPLASSGSSSDAVGGPNVPYLFCEFTNPGGTIINVTFNDFHGVGGGGSWPTDAVPIPANAVRQIPLAVYNWHSDAPINAVCYKP